mmetsp:Transcript_25909/g.80510  ORF Transcript_25909/g.80510 Transcript_25909/m.80510 type:complete len:317 (-) Transcript_25909:42-992(-)
MGQGQASAAAWLDAAGTALTGRKLEDVCEIDRGSQPLGQGSFGTVWRAKLRGGTGGEVAVKAVNKWIMKQKKIPLSRVLTEVDLMRECIGKPNIVQLVDFIDTGPMYYLVMEFCTGGNLENAAKAHSSILGEKQVLQVMDQLLQAVAYLHRRNICHRDVKPENIMFDLAPGLCREAPAKTPKTVKLIDFDTCVEWTPSSPKGSRFVGTPGYIAPEALLGEITPQSDIWSVGVILYILMTGETPWSSMVSLEDGVVGSPGARKMYNAIKAEVLEWDKEPWPDFPLARDLCQKLMAFSTDERPPSVQEALAHPWLEEP